MSNPQEARMPARMAISRLVGDLRYRSEAVTEGSYFASLNS